jgi:hypothetical protein
LIDFVETSVAEAHHFYAAPAPDKNFDAAPAPALEMKLILKNANFSYSALKQELILYSLHTVLYRIVYIIVIRTI